jgi:diadenosine tetraphosphatase ApaH/serine/threonine PP2A family protein phosphatase
LRYCVFGDVHGNLEALEAMVADARRQGVDRYVCVGDIVGYGADPVECVDRVQGLTTQIVAGNHDCAAVGRAELEYFNQYARDAVVWTRTQLSPSDKAFLRDLPLTLEVDELKIAHATLDRPDEFGYIECDASARRSFDALDGGIAFVGHSHVPVTFFYTLEKKQILFTKDLEIELDSSAKAIVNVGSVGQPRDNDPRGSYAVYDSAKRTVLIRRVSYSAEAAMQKILAAGLPPVLGERLLYGR